MRVATSVIDYEELKTKSRVSMIVKSTLCGPMTMLNRLITLIALWRLERLVCMCLCLCICMVVSACVCVCAYVCVREYARV